MFHSVVALNGIENIFFPEEKKLSPPLLKLTGMFLGRILCVKNTLFVLRIYLKFSLQIFYLLLDYDEISKGKFVTYILASLYSTSLHTKLYR